MVNDQFRKYFLYALGEIILVVIGILIALQVNEWNQVRKNEREEKVILSNLKNEFDQNVNHLKEVWEILGNSQESSLKIMQLMNQDRNILENHNLDSLIYWTIEYYPFNPSNNVFADLVQSGRLQLIRDEDLRNKLFEWSTEMENYRNSFEEYQHFVENQILVYLIDHMALKNIDQYSTLKWEEPSTFESDVASIFRDRKYENIVDNHMYHASLIHDHFIVLEKLIDQIILKCQ
jgi:hypothetical protein